MVSRVLIFVTIFVSCSYGENILAILPTPSYSHQIAYTTIWKELSLRGHKVTVLTTDPLKDPKLTNLTEIDLKWSYKFMAHIGKLAENEYAMWNMHETSMQLLMPVADAQITSQEVQSLIHAKKHFDLVLVEFLFPEFLAFAEIYNCPKIVFSSLDSSAIFHYAMGNPINPVLYPDVGATIYGALSFRERIESTLFSWYAFYFYTYKWFARQTEHVKKYFNVSRTVTELISDVDLIFVNVNPILQPIRAIGPSTITIGGNRPDVTYSVLPQDVAEFLNNAQEGFVYFSLGSNVKSKDLSRDTLEAITEALRELPYKVLWKFEADELHNKPANVKLIKWAPQQKVLSHPNIKLFVTQGGLQSLEEGIYKGVPLVVIPYFADQELNAKVVKSKGIAVVVDRKPSVNKNELKNAILEVIANPKYRHAVRRLKQLAMDFPMTGVEKAIWWIEYVIRHKGAKHLRSPAADIPFYQYYLIDVIGFLLIVVIVVLYVLSLLVTKVVQTFQSNLQPKRKKISRSYESLLVDMFSRIGNIFIILVNYMHSHFS